MEINTDRYEVDSQIVIAQNQGNELPPGCVEVIVRKPDPNLIENIEPYGEHARKVSYGLVDGRPLKKGLAEVFYEDNYSSIVDLAPDTDNPGWLYFVGSNDLTSSMIRHVIVYVDGMECDVFLPLINGLADEVTLGANAFTFAKLKKLKKENEKRMKGVVL